MITRSKFEVLLGQLGFMINRGGAKDSYEEGLMEGLATAIEAVTGANPVDVVFATRDAYLDGSEDEALAGKLIAEQLERGGFLLPS
ncbi:hypothetical protein [Actinomadura sp. WMMB 499]|uniref:hypothetical protein n=1 Tax=Actinomadura sp. WMMB 499 TaxID=1219491 RepID=UPI001247558F|nr:hypothetical protein [Actinomadura sp. WMMB 499]QFG25416.1 hypothetical protein F7P10_33930 [Actinomadura sp. WMMB 499]